MAGIVRYFQNNKEIRFCFPSPRANHYSVWLLVAFLNGHKFKSWLLVFWKHELPFGFETGALFWKDVLRWMHAKGLWQCYTSCSHPYCPTFFLSPLLQHVFSDVAYYTQEAFQQFVAKSHPTPFIIGFIRTLTCQRGSIELSIIYEHGNKDACV